MYSFFLPERFADDTLRRARRNVDYPPSGIPIFCYRYCAECLLRNSYFKDQLFCRMPIDCCGYSRLNVAVLYVSRDKGTH